MKVTNPLLRMDMPDMDVIKANGYYYMVSTTMFFCPGGPILRSQDLKNWEIVSYIFDKIEDNDIYELKNGKNAYGACQWATTLCFHKGMFYACFVCNDMKKTYIFYTNDIEKSFWNRYELDGIYYDPSFLFWENQPYLVYGNGEIHIAKLKEDFSGLEPSSERLLLSTEKDGIMLRCEGCRAYVRNGFIYLCFIEWPNEGNGNGRRREICYRSTSLDGEFERRIIFDDDMGYKNCGIAQGVLIDVDEKNCYSMLFQDHGAVGRIPYLLPMRWENDWPVIGVDGKAPVELDLPIQEMTAAQLVTSDSFNHSSDRMLLQFQWNHNPIKEGWSFTERPGYLRLKNKQIASSIMDARNTLTERTVTPKSVFTIEGDFSNLKDGDYAGLTAFMGRFGTVGVSRECDDFFITLKRFDGVEKKISAKELTGFNVSNVWLRIIFDFENDDKAYFFYSVDGINFIQIGDALEMQFTLDVFVGYRIGVFSYGTKELDGMADFRNLIYNA